MIPALFILHHLYLVLALFGAALLAVVAYGVGREHATRYPTTGWPRRILPTILIDWVGQTPVAVVPDPATAADVAAWLEAVRESVVLRV